MEEKIKRVKRLRDAIKPDYFVTAAQVKKYGYDKGYLYPVYRSRARLFYDFGLTVYMLGKENKKTEIRSEKDFWDAGMRNIQANVGKVYTLSARIFILGRGIIDGALRRDGC